MTGERESARTFNPADCGIMKQLGPKQIKVHLPRASRDTMKLSQPCGLSPYKRDLFSPVFTNSKHSRFMKDTPKEQGSEDVPCKSEDWRSDTQNPMRKPGRQGGPPAIPSASGRGSLGLAG